MTMKLLLGTHVLLWWLDDNPALLEQAHSTITDSHNLVALSAVTILEIGIKQALGKLTIPKNFFEIIKRQPFEMLSFAPDHSYGTGDLPMHHRYPFDRMIITQAKLEGFTVVTHDAVFRKYDIPVLEVWT